MHLYTQADQQIHWLSQVLAKVNRAFVPEKADDSHTNLYFDPLTRRLMGRWIDSPRGKFLLALKLEPMQFEWLNKTLQVQATVPVWEKSLRELEEEVAGFAGRLELDSQAVHQELHFQIPDYQIATLKSGDVSREGLQSWLFFRDVGNAACQRTKGLLQTPSEIRIWPHHFDTGIYMQVTAEFGIGFGLAMSDSMVGEPYFYLAGYSTGAPMSYQDKPDLSPAYWEAGEHWQGAILPLGKIEEGNRNAVKQIVDAFIRNAALWYLEK